MAQKYFKQESKKDWYTSVSITNDDLQTGALMRIADATELMASNYLKLQNDYKYMKEDRDRYRDWYHKEQKKSAALKGHITRLKNNQSV